MRVSMKQIVKIVAQREVRTSIRFVAAMLFVWSGVGLFLPVYVFAETVTGGGYTVEQIIAPIQGRISGNGYVLQQSSQVVAGRETGGGYSVTGVFGSSVQATSSGGGGGGSGGGGGGGYYIFLPPTNATPTVTVTTASGTITTTEIIPYTQSLPSGTTRTCKSRVTFSAPIDFGASTNVKADVVKLETFLNEYENEKLKVNGIYERRDFEAVKRWQSKYASFVLDPMLLKKPTGTVYTLSQRQIERQTTKPCGQPIIVTACPFFREYASYGDRGVTVRKIQQFLNIVRGEKLPLSGVYGPLTKAAVKRFQEAYRKDIFNILRLSFISGNWNEATRVKANQAIGCDVVK